MISDRLYRATSGVLRRQAARIVKRLPHRRRVVSWRGQRIIIDPSENSGFYLYYEQEYDDEIFAFLDQRIARYDLVLDLGANIGVYTCYFASHVPTVVAYEPDAAVAQRLHENIAGNHHANVTVDHRCVGERSGTVSFFKGDDRNSGIGGLTGHGSHIEVECTSLDEMFPDGIKSSCLVKIDIEGAELLALRGARKMLAASPSVDMLIELHPDQIASLGGSAEQIRTMLRDMNYTTAPMPFAGGERFWWVTRHS